jgi:hypothetical protein
LKTLFSRLCQWGKIECNLSEARFASIPWLTDLRSSRIRLKWTLSSDAYVRDDLFADGLRRRESRNNHLELLGTESEELVHEDRWLNYFKIIWLNAHSKQYKSS